MLHPRSEARGLTVGDGVEIGDGVLFGANVVVGDGTRIGAGSIVEDAVLLGKVPRLARTSSARGAPPGPLRIGERVTVCAGAIVYAGTLIGHEAIVGDQAQVRERAEVGPGTVIGRGSAIDNDVRIGARVKVQTNVYVTAFSVVEDDVFIGPGASTTNDDTMSRHAPGAALRGATLRRACRIGGSAVLVPGVEVGEEAFVAAGAVVTKDVPARAFMIGVPARQVREVRDDELLERWR
ncbi:MAG TPA: acyltransferase [Solirubrobacteraceae bacterium]|nr:acyltransferase [Solirubrobacteraceae bacterium]